MAAHSATVAPVAPIRRESTLLQLLRNRQGLIWLSYLVLLVAVALLAPTLALYDVNVTDLAATNAKPFTPGHPLGGDGAGYDIYSRLIWGSRQTLIAVLIVVSVSAAIGATSGLVAGFYRGIFETAASFVSDAIMSLPGVVLLIALYAVTGPNLPAAMGVFGVIVAPTYYRLVRSIVITVRKELYIDAARVSGLSDLRIVGRHVLWAVRAPIIIHSSFIMAAGIGIESGVSFIGLGNPAAASWGTTLQRSFNGIYNNPWGVVWPSLLISITILAFVLLGNVLSDVLQSSSRNKVLSARQRRSVIARSAAVIGEVATAEPSKDSILSIRGLRIGYLTPDGEVREVVHGVDFDLRRGEIHGLVGESGSGKSQIAFATLGILPREALVLDGSVFLNGEDLMADPRKMRAARGRRIAYIPQEPMSNLDPSFTVGAQLIYGLCAVRPMSRPEAREILLALLQRVGIKDPERVMKMYPHEISGGMAQRVLICGAVASEPDIIVADEPTTALDVTVQAEVLDLLRELSEERGLAMILVTHNLGVVADLCHTVTVMKDGRFVENAGVEQIFDSPSDPYTVELLRSSRSVELMEIAS
ncbi:dipeptide/oligopeptide/nickel ABC transporter permease/ATP-binding protein [Devosia rhodophyticola]|uniref:Nickel import system ATP-binding protein NikD n=1 Tax=Devosia rhodophyticola TaxID=3026423 RepID=A0ABY7YXX4_9HYPH|nr:dipeptide/oligopeptide/nickel ABC transporter permease/ATP-binding protein [Devosia rhodophyticola]WDR06067.1 dipeptide/oligopeptide/nickel ABC transporter permease/ATP-binding protein [Devosia rhodophyticola]